MLSEGLHGSFEPSRGKRGAARRILRLGTEITTSGSPRDAVVHNLSRTGALIETKARLEIGDTFTIELHGGEARFTEIIWADDNLFGCRFMMPLSQASVSAALLRADPVAAAHTPRRAPNLAERARILAAFPQQEEAKPSARARVAIIVTLSTLIWAVILGSLYLLFL